MASQTKREGQDQRLRAFGAAVREARNALGLSQEQFGYRAGMDRTYVSGIERGARNPTAQVMWRIADALGEPLSDLLARAEELRL
jgi:transcriptional regulator with XRE-family HTH domain